MNCFQTVFGLTPAIHDYIGGITMNDHPPHVQLPSRCLDMTWEALQWLLPSSPTSVFVQATRLKNWDRSWDRDWKGLRSSAESWTLRTAIIPFWVWFLRYLIWFQRLCEWYFRNLQEIIWMSFGSSSSLKRFETDAFFDAKDRWPVSLWRRHWALFFGLAARGTARIAYGMQSRYQGTV